MAESKWLILYAPSLDRRWLDPELTPFVCDALARRGVTQLHTHPSVELLPALVTGVWPHEHGCWQVSRRPITPRTVTQQLIDRLPRFWTTSFQCLRHRLNPEFDVPTVEPRRRRQLKFHRIKNQRRQGGDAQQIHFDVPTLFDRLGEASRFRTVFSFDAHPDLAALIDGQPRLDFIELYTLDLFSHWNADRPEAMRHHLAEVDRQIAAIVAHAESLDVHSLLVVDHGHEPIRHTINLPEVLRETGVPTSKYLYYSEVGNARFWFDTDRARQTLEAALREIDHATYLTAEEMAEYHIHFPREAGFGDGYLITDAGTAFFPHDFYHPLVNAYMARKTTEQSPRKISPVHRGNHGGLPGKHPCDTGYLVPLTGTFEPLPPEAQLIDFAPTVLSLLGETVPDELEGQVLLRPTVA
ncbi:MAG: alkaline phosphatase family protein [Planctomycetota bacterium]